MKPKLQIIARLSLGLDATFTNISIQHGKTSIDLDADEAALLMRTLQGKEGALYKSKKGAYQAHEAMFFNCGKKLVLNQEEE